MNTDNDDRYLSDPRYVRWQGMTIAQFSVSIALLSGLSVSALGAGMSLLQQEVFARQAPYQLAFILAMLLFVAVVVLCLVATISRTLDFRLTARKVRGRCDLILFGMSDKQFGRISWFLFWLAVLAFSVGTALFLISAGFFLARQLLCSA